MLRYLYYINIIFIYLILKIEMTELKTYNLALSVNWIYDWDFINAIEKVSHEQGLSTFVIHDDNLEETLIRINNDLLFFNFLFDRASDSSSEFLKFQNILKSKNTKIIDSYEKLKWVSDKATMHLEFINNGIETPYTFIIPPYDSYENIYIPEEELIKMGNPFIVKPANTTGGGIGVFDNAKNLNDILETRKKFKKDKYLVQQKIYPVEKDGKYFWFRCFYTFGYIQCTWWNNITKKYQLLENIEVSKYKLEKLSEIVEAIYRIININFFSTEIALDKNNKFIVIDYVNELCDMRFQSKHYDGIPDIIINNITKYLVHYIKERLI